MNTTNFIHRTNISSNYTIISNAIINDDSLTATARSILIYLLSKPPHWRFNAIDVKRKMSIGLNKVYRCMNELIRAGYAIYRRTQSKVDWLIFDTKQTTKQPESLIDIDRVNFDHVQNHHELEINESLVSNEPQPTLAPAPSIEAHKVVVSCNDETLQIPAELKGSQQRAAKKLLSNISHEEALAVLLVFNAALKSKKLGNPIGYLHSLVKSAQDGSFTPIISDTPITLNERIAKQREAQKQAQTAKINNASFFEELKRSFGVKAEKAIPEQWRAD